MEEIPIWEVDLSVYGPIKIRVSHSMKIFKGFKFNDPFYSDIELRNADFGVEASITAFASKSELAHKAALIFFGQMLDTLALRIRQPLFLSFTEERTRNLKEYNVRRLVEENEWKSAFRESRLLNAEEPVFLRALGWYRKGLYTEDPFDKFLAFWNSIEITASKYHPKTTEAKRGIKNQIYECFKTIWGNDKHWPAIIRDSNKWIRDNYQTRKDIAHGVASVNIDAVQNVLSKLDDVEQIAHIFLSDWRRKQIRADDHISPLLKHIGIES